MLGSWNAILMLGSSKKRRSNEKGTPHKKQPRQLFIEDGVFGSRLRSS